MVNEKALASILWPTLDKERREVVVVRQEQIDMHPKWKDSFFTITSRVPDLSFRMTMEKVDRIAAVMV